MHRVIPGVIAAVCLLSAPQVSLAQQDSVFIIRKNDQTLMRVNANGNVGIGVSMPLVKLHILGGLATDSIRTGSIRFADGSALNTAAPAARHQAVYGPGWGANSEPVTYMKDQNGVVYIQGTAKPVGFTGLVVFTLPPGYRPANNIVMEFLVQDAGAPARLIGTILPDGNVTVQYPVQIIFFNNIAFLAKQ